MSGLSKALFLAAAGIAGLSGYSKKIEGRAYQGLIEPPYKIKGDYLVSIVIPALEEENYLPDLLVTIQNQTYSPIEIIIADSSPSPSNAITQNICHEFSAKYTYLPKGNISAARNEGARQAIGDILIFVDADCYMSHEYVERMVDALESGYVLAHGVDPHLDGLFLLASTAFALFLKPRDYTSRGMAIWTDAFIEIGGFNESFILGEREDLQLGRDVKEMFGIESICLDKNAIIGTSSRRERAIGIRFPYWVNVRDGKVFL